MILLIQRIKGSEIKVDGKLVAKSGKGLLLYVGFEREDNLDLVEQVGKKVIELKIFGEKWEKTVKEIGGEIIVISNFTLPGRVKGKRINFSRSLKFEEAEKLYHHLIKVIGREVPCKSGIFGAMMEITSTVDGPVNLLIQKKNGE